MVTVDLSFSISMQLTADTQIINLIESLKVMIRAAHSVEVQGFREGSLIVTVTMAESDLYRLAAAFSDGELESTGVTEIKQVNLEMGSMLVFPIVLNKQTIMARRLQDLGTEPPVGQGGSPLGIQDVILPPYVPRKEKVDTPPDEL